MSINLLRQAHKVIPYERIEYKALIVDDTENSIGFNIKQYEDSQYIFAKLNAVNTDLYQTLGLDYKKNYYILHIIPKISGLSRVDSGDVFRYNNLVYQVETGWGWQSISNWDSYICIEIPNDNVLS